MKTLNHYPIPHMDREFTLAFPPSATILGIDYDNHNKPMLAVYLDPSDTSVNHNFHIREAGETIHRFWEPVDNLESTGEFKTVYMERTP